MARKPLEKRAKLAIASIVTLVAIGVLHAVVYQERLSDYRQAYGAYMGQRNQVANARTIDPSAINAYRTETEQFRARAAEVRQSINVDWPVHFMKKDATPEDISLRKKDIRAIAKKIREQQAAQLPRLDFLGEAKPNPQMDFFPQNIGWHFPSQLVADYQTRPKKLVDDIVALKAIRGKIDALSRRATDQRQLELYNYYTKMVEMGINPSLYVDLAGLGELGSNVPLFAMITFADLMTEKLREIDSAATISVDNLEDLLFLLPTPRAQSTGQMAISEAKLSYPADFRYSITAYGQLVMLNDLIERARKYKIASISKVRLQDDWMYHAGLEIRSWEHFLTAKERAAITASPSFSSGGEEGEDYSEDEGGDEDSVGIPGTVLDRLKAGVDTGGFGGGPADTATDDDDINWTMDTAPYRLVSRDVNTGLDWVGMILPIEITFQSTNAEAMEFLHHLAHCERGYEIHYLSFNIDETKRSPVLNVRATVLGYAYINGVTQSVGGEVVDPIAASTQAPSEAPAPAEAPQPGAAPAPDAATTGGDVVAPAEPAPTAPEPAPADGEPVPAPVQPEPPAGEAAAEGEPAMATDDMAPPAEE